MKHLIIYSAAASCLFGAWPVTAAATIAIGRSDTGMVIAFDTELGKTYGIQVSADLEDWADLGLALEGDGIPATHLLADPQVPRGFYRLSITDNLVELAPTAEQFQELVVGTSIYTYDFVSSTRFEWFDETGNWSYTKTGADKAKLVLTYDEDQNDPDVYREEILMTFASPTSGTARYSEYYGSVEIPSSVQLLPFDLSG